MSYNKSSTFLAKYKYDSEETPLKQPHHDAFTPKQETLERIKQLHIQSGFLDTEHLFMLPINWLEYQEFADVNVDITKNVYNAYCMQIYVFAEKYFKSNFLQSFMWPL